MPKQYLQGKSNYSIISKFRVINTLCATNFIRELEFTLSCRYLTQHWISLKIKQPITPQKHAINSVPKEVTVVHRKDVYHLITITTHRNIQLAGSHLRAVFRPLDFNSFCRIKLKLTTREKAVFGFLKASHPIAKGNPPCKNLCICRLL